MNNLDLIKKFLNDEKRVLETRLDAAKISCQNAPKATESRSDTSRAYYEVQIENFAKRIQELENLISRLPKILPEAGPLWHQFDKYVLVPDGYGGRKIGDLFLASISSPIGQQLEKK